MNLGITDYGGPVRQRRCARQAHRPPNSHPEKSGRPGLAPLPRLLQLGRYSGGIPCRSFRPIDLRKRQGSPALCRGDYDRETVFDDDPAAVARSWEEQGGTRIHLVDLDGAREGTKPARQKLAASIARAVHRPPSQLGGRRPPLWTTSPLSSTQESTASSWALSPLQILSLSERRVKRYGERIAVWSWMREMAALQSRGWTEDSGRRHNRAGPDASPPNGVRRFIHTGHLPRRLRCRGVNVEGPCRTFAEAVAPIPRHRPQGGVHHSRWTSEPLAATDIEAVIIGPRPLHRRHLPPGCNRRRRPLTPPLFPRRRESESHFPTQTPYRIK